MDAASPVRQQPDVRVRRLTGAEVVAATLLAIPASAILAAYLLDRLGVAFPPARLLPLGLLSGAAAWFSLRRRSLWGPGSRADLGLFVAVLAAVFAWLMWAARPWFLPLSSDGDLTHHLLLIGFIEQHWTLVHEPIVEAYLGEMVHYTPGSQILAALAGAVARSDGLHAVHAVVAASVALKAGLVVLITLRLLPPDVPRIPFALLSGVLLLVPYNYFLGSFMRESFFAQVAGECFAVAMWWTLSAWDESPWIGLMAVFSLAGAAAFLTWPVWIGAPMVALAVLVIAREELPLAERIRHLAAAVVPVAIIAGLYITGRAGWMQIVRTAGFVLHPALPEYSWWFLALSALGLAIAAVQRRGRATAVFAGAIALEMLGLFIAARTRGNDTPYMALKMFYLLIYPQAVVATLAVAFFVSRIGLRLGGTSHVMRYASWALVAMVGLIAARRLAGMPPPKPAISQSLALAGAWARDHVPASCVDYMVGETPAAYWLHLSALGNPRMSARTGNDATFDETAAIVRWLTPGGLPYAIAELPALPADVRADLDIVADFGSAAVVKRRGPSSCP